MLLSSKNFVALNTRRRWLKRGLICLALSPIIVSVLYGAIIFAIWILLELEKLAGGPGNLLPYTTSGSVAVVTWFIWSRQAQKAEYLKYLESQSDDDLVAVTASTVHSRSDKKVAAKILQTRRAK